MNYGKEFYQTYGQFAGDTLSPEIIRLARPYIEGKVLDVGAGDGAMMNEVYKLNYVHPLQQEPIREVKGIDICPKNGGIIEAPITKIPFVGNYFDTVICSEVIEHLDDNTFDKGISEVYRVLKPSGYLIITCPADERLSDNLMVCPACHETFHRWGHVRTIDTKNPLRNMIYRPYLILRTTGFKTIKEEVIPLGFMATHKILRYFMPIIKSFPFVRYEPRSLFIVAQKV